MFPNNKTSRVLLISNSTLYGSGYLDHAESEFRSFLGHVKQVLFVPYALFDRDKYAGTAQQRFQKTPGWTVLFNHGLCG
jgi:dipeptidase E